VKLSRIEILSREDIDAIYSAALHVLGRVGVQYRYEPTLKLLEENGCEVDYKTEIAKLPEGLVEDCLRYTPRQMVFRGRDQSKDLRVVAGGRAHVSGGTGCRHLLTYPDNKYKPYTTEDVAHKARLCDYLPLVKGVGMPGEGGLDYPEEVCSVYALEAFHKRSIETAFAWPVSNSMSSLPASPAGLAASP